MSPVITETIEWERAWRKKYSNGDVTEDAFALRRLEETARRKSRLRF